MKYEISAEEAKEIIRGLACLAATSEKPDKSFEILNFKFIPKSLVLELGSIVRYTIETYTFKKEYLKEDMVEIIVDFIVKDSNTVKIPCELVVGIDKIQNKGYIYILPEIVADKIDIKKVLKVVKGYSKCRDASLN